MPRPINSTWVMLGARVDLAVQARYEVGHRDIKQARSRHGHGKGQHRQRLFQREEADNATDDRRQARQQVQDERTPA